MMGKLWRGIKNNNKKMVSTIVLLLFTLLMMTGQKDMEGKDTDMGSGQRGMGKSITVVSSNPSIQQEDHKEPKYRRESYREGERLEWLEESEYMQLEQPFHFRLYIDDALSTEYDSYRNVSVENWLDGTGRYVPVENTSKLHIADIVTDTYIREYGGEDGVYELSRELSRREIINPETGRIEAIYYQTISSETVEMELWSVGWIHHVYIKNMPHEKNELSEYFLLEKYAAYGREAGILGNYTKISGEKEYWMVVNPERAKAVRQYRNVDPESNLYQVDSLGYYIADLAVDKYLRYYQVSEVVESRKIRNYDVIYQVKMVGKELDKAAQGYIYRMEVRYGRELLTVEYSDYSWLVKTEVMREEKDYDCSDMQRVEKVEESDRYINPYFPYRGGEVLYGEGEYEDDVKIEKAQGMVKMEISHVKDYEKGNVYKLSMRNLNHYGEDRAHIYLYVTPEKIYRITYTEVNNEIIYFHNDDERLKEIFDTDEKITYHADIVGQEETVDGEYYYHGGCKIYRAGRDIEEENRIKGSYRINMLNEETGYWESGYYEGFTWKKNVGLVEYFSGYGMGSNIRDNIYLDIIREGTYWMIVNPEMVSYEKPYRNVNPEINSYPVEDVAYHIADQAIDKYIRDYNGSNEIYQVKHMGWETKEGADGYIYYLEVSYGEEMLIIEYSDDSCLVEVQVDLQD